jgi:hypothetical protein
MDSACTQLLLPHEIISFFLADSVAVIASLRNPLLAATG